MEPLAADAVPADCAALDAQVAEAEKFRAQVAHTSEFSGADVLAFLIDFGIGNAIEKSAALKSADEREEKLKERQAKLGCTKGLQRVRTNEPADEAPRHTADVNGGNG
jgi:hypothetical protein